MTTPDYTSAKDYALQRLSVELPPTFYYHSLHHTAYDVLPAAERFAEFEAVSEVDMLLVRTAAVYHDIGYLEQRLNHEEGGVRIARQVLPDFGYSPHHLDIISGMIMATKLPQTPRTLLEQIIADADMDSLGREDFLETSHNLRDELASTGVVVELQEWYRRQTGFLQTHRYFTQAARHLRDAGKQANIERLQRLLDAP